MAYYCGGLAAGALGGLLLGTALVGTAVVASDIMCSYHGVYGCPDCAPYYCHHHHSYDCWDCGYVHHHYNPSSTVRIIPVDRLQLPAFEFFGRLAFRIEHIDLSEGSVRTKSLFHRDPNFTLTARFQPRAPRVVTNLFHTCHEWDDCAECFGDGPCTAEIIAQHPWMAPQMIKTDAIEELKAPFWSSVCAHLTSVTGITSAQTPRDGFMGDLQIFGTRNRSHGPHGISPTIIRFYLRDEHRHLWNKPIGRAALDLSAISFNIRNTSFVQTFDLPVLKKESGPQRIGVIRVTVIFECRQSLENYLNSTSQKLPSGAVRRPSLIPAIDPRRPLVQPLPDPHTHFIPASSEAQVAQAIKTSLDEQKSADAKSQAQVAEAIKRSLQPTQPETVQGYGDYTLPARGTTFVVPQAPPTTTPKTISRTQSSTMFSTSRAPQPPTTSTDKMTSISSFESRDSLTNGDYYSDDDHTL